MKGTADLDEFKFSHLSPVRFSDLDVLGHVNHIGFIDILENARIAYYYQVMGLQSVAEIRFVLAELHVRYLAQATLGQTLRTAIRTVWLKRSSSQFAYQIRDETTDTLLTAGDGIQVYMNLEANRSSPLPAAYRQRVLAFEGHDLSA